MIYFTSDTHFGHANILKYCKPTRQFDNIRDHDEHLIEMWNKTVKPEDTIYHLGDFGMPRGNPRQNREFIWSVHKRLNGNKRYLKGNHDKDFPKEIVQIPYAEIKIPDDEMDLKQVIILCHYPFAVWNKSHHGSWHLHGHCHGTFPTGKNMARLDVGVDVAKVLLGELRPFSYEEIKEHMTNKVFEPVDGHGGKGYMKEG